MVQNIIKTVGAIVEATNKYMAETVLVDEDYVGVRHDCFNTSTDELCAFKAASDQCIMTGNFEDLVDDDEDVLAYTFMISNYTPSCKSCHELLVMSDGIKEITEDCTPALETCKWR